MDDEEIEEYFKKFIDFMQVELHKKYDLRSRKRSRLQDNVEEQTDQIVQQQSPSQVDKGKQQINKVPTITTQHGEISNNK